MVHTKWPHFSPEEEVEEEEKEKEDASLTESSENRDVGVIMTMEAGTDLSEELHVHVTESFPQKMLNTYQREHVSETIVSSGDRKEETTILAAAHSSRSHVTEPGADSRDRNGTSSIPDGMGMEYTAKRGVASVPHPPPAASSSTAELSKLPGLECRSHSLASGEGNMAGLAEMGETSSAESADESCYDSVGSNSPPLKPATPPLRQTTPTTSTLQQATPTSSTHQQTTPTSPTLQQTSLTSPTHQQATPPSPSLHSEQMSEEAVTGSTDWDVDLLTLSPGAAQSQLGQEAGQLERERERQARAAAGMSSHVYREAQVSHFTSFLLLFLPLLFIHVVPVCTCMCF